MKVYKIITGTLFGFLPLLLAGCSDKEMAVEGGAISGDDGELSEVTFVISTENATGSTRAGEDIRPHISSGGKIDKLIYSIYEYDEGKKEFKVAPYYFEEGKTQATVEPFKADDKYKLTLKVAKDKEYKLVCWAQSSACDAYDTSDLANIEVSYDNAINNDETRDAFTANIGFSGNLRHQEIAVVLRRPFAQINIGTSGADYANLIYDEALIPSAVTINKSMIKVTGVANKYNALTCIATAEPEEGSEEVTAVFDWAPLPAWINLTNTESPKFKDGGYATRAENPFVQLLGNNAGLEEFLYVKHNDEETKELTRSLKGEDGEKTQQTLKRVNGYFPYLTDYPTLIIDDKGEKTWYTETFKYLSMCYVLVPTNLNDEKEPTRNTVTVNFNLQEDKGVAGEKARSLTERELLTVPVQANYRTNILGGLHTTDEEQDPTSIFNYYVLPIMLIRDFNEPANNEYYYTATLNVYRDDPDGDDLTIQNVLTKDYIDTTDGTGSATEEVKSLSEEIDFTGEKAMFEFTVKEGYLIEITSNVEKKTVKGDKTITNWSLTPDDVEKSERFILTIYPGSSAANFTIRVSKTGANTSGDGSDSGNGDD